MSAYDYDHPPSTKDFLENPDILRGQRPGTFIFLPAECGVAIYEALLQYAANPSPQGTPEYEKAKTLYAYLFSRASSVFYGIPLELVVSEVNRVLERDIKPAIFPPKKNWDEVPDPIPCKNADELLAKFYRLYYGTDKLPNQSTDTPSADPAPSRAQRSVEETVIEALTARGRTPAEAEQILRRLRRTNDTT